MKMKSQRKVERDRAKRAARTRVRPASQSETAVEGADESLDDLDLPLARSVLGYDE